MGWCDLMARLLVQHLAINSYEILSISIKMLPNDNKPKILVLNVPNINSKQCQILNKICKLCQTLFGYIVVAPLNIA